MINQITMAELNAVMQVASHHLYLWYHRVGGRSGSVWIPISCWILIRIPDSDPGPDPVLQFSTISTASELSFFIFFSFLSNEKTITLAV
jgi:hypothetical protein